MAVAPFSPEYSYNYHDFIALHNFPRGACPVCKLRKAQENISYKDLIRKSAGKYSIQRINISPCSRHPPCETPSSSPSSPPPP